MTHHDSVWQISLYQNAFFLLLLQMDYVDSISGTENVEQEKRAEHHRHKHTKALQLSTEYVLVMITLSSACIQSVCVCVGMFFH